MKRSLQFIGVVGLTALVFGGVASLFTFDESGLFPRIHFGIAAVALLWFLVRGGLQLMSGAALKRTSSFGAGLLLYCGLFLSLLTALNLYVYRHDPLHYDSTEQQVYTLAPQTQKVLSGLQNPVIARGFFVGGEVNTDTRELLDRMERASVNFSWEAIDPEKDPRATERYGISERDTVHFSFADGSSERAAKVVRDLDEQSLVNAVLKLTRGGSKKVYWIGGHGEANLDDETEAGFLFLKEAIAGENLEVAQLDLAARGEVPADASAVMLMGPRRALLPRERETLQGYLERGGSMLLLNEPNTTADIAELVKPLGITVGSDVVLDQVLQMFSGPKIGVQPVVGQYARHPATEGFNKNIILSTVTSVTVAEDNGSAVELAFTGDGSWAEKDVASIFSENPTTRIPPENERGPVSIAAAFQGPLTVAEPAQPGSAEESKEKPTGSYAGRILVIGDSDFVANVNIRQLFNRDFFLNALNWVVGEQERISIRERTLRTSTETITPEQFKKIFLLGGVLLPELVLLWGFAVYFWRR